MIETKMIIYGRCMDAIISPLYEKKAAGTRIKRNNPTTATQKWVNIEHKIKRLARLIEGNFDENDCSFVLTFKNEPHGYDEIQKIMQAFMRRVKYACEKHGLTSPKYIFFNSQFDLETDKRTRWHVHLIVNKEVREIIKNSWELGHTKEEQLGSSATGTARYLVMQVEESISIEETGSGKSRKKNRKAWTSSKNLQKPIVVVEDDAISASEYLYLTMNIDDRRFIEKKFEGYHCLDGRVVEATRPCFRKIVYLDMKEL